MVKLIAKALLKRSIRTVIAAIVLRILARRIPILGLVLFALPDAVRACSVCFGDPESPMMKGAAAGVYVMVGVVAFVLTGIAGTAGFWLIRARRLSATQPQSLT